MTNRASAAPLVTGPELGRKINVGVAGRETGVPVGIKLTADRDSLTEERGS
jgi:hypothetical protein